jgi:hypothetical protein
MTILGKCSCKADCEMASPECEGFVKPIGLDALDQWVHSCKTHHDANLKNVTTGAQTVDAFEWDVRGPG